MATFSQLSHSTYFSSFGHYSLKTTSSLARTQKHGQGVFTSIAENKGNIVAPFFDTLFYHCHRRRPPPLSSSSPSSSDLTPVARHAVAIVVIVVFVTRRHRRRRFL